MQINVKTYRGDEFTVKLTGQATVAKLKDAIYRTNAVYAVHAQKVIFAGVELRDDERVSSLDIGASDFVAVVDKNATDNEATVRKIRSMNSDLFLKVSNSETDALFYADLKKEEEEAAAEASRIEEENAAEASRIEEELEEPITPSATTSNETVASVGYEGEDEQLDDEEEDEASIYEVFEDLTQLEMFPRLRQVIKETPNLIMDFLDETKNTNEALYHIIKDNLDTFIELFESYEVFDEEVHADEGEHSDRDAIAEEHEDVTVLSANVIKDNNASKDSNVNQAEQVTSQARSPQSTSTAVNNKRPRDESSDDADDHDSDLAKKLKTNDEANSDDADKATEIIKLSTDVVSASVERRSAVASKPYKVFTRTDVNPESFNPVYDTTRRPTNAVDITPNTSTPGDLYTVEMQPSDQLVIQRLSSLGFMTEQCVVAYLISGKREQRAIELLQSGMLDKRA